MSTRAGIIIKDGHSEQHFYRHSDGYPEGTKPTLEKFLQYVKDGKIRDNTSQAAGWLIIIGAEEYNGNYGMGCPKCEDNIEYGRDDEKCPKCGAGLFYIRVNKSIESLTTPGTENGMDWKVGAYEPTDNVKNHGDLEYVYTVNLKTKKISTRKPR